MPTIFAYLGSRISHLTFKDLNKNEQLHDWLDPKYVGEINLR